MSALIRSAQLLDKERLLSVTPAPRPPAPAFEGGHEALAPPAVLADASPEPGIDAGPVLDTPDPQAPPGAAQGEPESRAPTEEERRAQELESALQAARAEAFDEGHRRGMQAAEEAWGEGLASLQRLVEAAQEGLRSAVTGHEDAIVEIVFEAVCKILGRAMQEKEGVLAAVREVIGRAHERRRLVIHVAPRDFAMLEKAQHALRPDAPRAELVADERVALGGCLVETAGGTLDGRLEIQLQLLREVLLSARRSLPEGAA